MSVKVLHRGCYVDVRQAVQMMRAVPRVCRTQPYLDCVVAHNEAVALARKFSEALGDPSLCDPEAFQARWSSPATNILGIQHASAVPQFEDGYFVGGDS